MARTGLPYMGQPRSPAPLSGGGADWVKQAHDAGRKPKSERSTPGSQLVQKRHQDWQHYQITWRWMLDSYEGGTTYRNAVYGPDRQGRVVRNLIRHKREYPDQLEYPTTVASMGTNATAALGTGIAAMVGPLPGLLGAHQNATAHDDEYEYRRARTPVPEFVREAVEIHTGKVYDHTISRRGPAELELWWENCDGGGTGIDRWARETIAPLVLVLGCVDVVLDRPQLPPWVTLETKQDEIDFNQTGCCAAVILPQNMVWWRNDPAGNYLECLVREYWSPTLGTSDDEGSPLEGDEGATTIGFPGEPQPEHVRYRHWTSTEVTLYNGDGEIVEATRKHGYPCVPIVRLIDQKRPRSPMIGKPRYEVIAEYQSEYYNRDSELILNDTQQAHPLLSGPAEYCRGEQTIAIGPGFVLPIYQRPDGGGAVGWQFVSPPKDPANSIRANLAVIRDNVDRAACLAKPAGTTHSTSEGTVSQSGYSKAMDAESGTKLLGNISRMLARVERQIAEFALMCIRRKPITPADRDAIVITYPSRFQLKPAAEILTELERLVNICAIETQVAEGTPGQKTLQPPKTPDDQIGGNPPQPDDEGAGQPGQRFLLPTLIGELAVEFARVAVQGRDDSINDQIAAEAKAFFHLRMLPTLGIASKTEAMAGHGTEEEMAEEDRTGQSGATDVSPVVPTLN